MDRHIVRIRKCARNAWDTPVWTGPMWRMGGPFQALTPQSANKK